MGADQQAGTDKARSLLLGLSADKWRAERSKGVRQRCAGRNCPRTTVPTGTASQTRHPKARGLASAMKVIHVRPETFEQPDIERAGAFLTLDRSGRIAVYRGLVRPEDEASMPVDGGDESNVEGDPACHAGFGSQTFVPGASDGAGTGSAAI